ncbi:hypothetical protein [Streptomyces sp. ODS05-4]|uniref:hypothetical protein n=1 Tax=Streptomyces sp. ODS05-4 TaxID=2944939 RepID=UPI00387E9CBD
MQNIGRALRLNRDGSTKVARIIVPVFLEPGEDLTDMVASASFEPLVAVLQGLRSNDERLVEQLASRALTSGKRKVHIKRDEGGGSSAPAARATDRRVPAHPGLPAGVLVWLEGYQALIRWRAENEITGVHALPYDTEVKVGVTKDFPPRALGALGGV